MVYEIITIFQVADLTSMNVTRESRLLRTGVKKRQTSVNWRNGIEKASRNGPAIIIFMCFSNWWSSVMKWKRYFGMTAQPQLNEEWKGVSESALLGPIGVRLLLLTLLARSIFTRMATDTRVQHRSDCYPQPPGRSRRINLAVACLGVEEDIG